MLGHQLRQRGLRAVHAPGAIVGLGFWRAQEAAFASNADGKAQNGAASERAQPPTQRSNEQPKTTDNIQVHVGHGSAPAGAASEPSQPSRATTEAMARLKAKLTAEGSRASAPPAGGQSAQQPPQHQTSSRPAPQTPSAASGAAKPPATQTPATQPRQAATFQGISLQLGEAGNPLQGMAVLTHTTPRQLEEYGSDPLAADQRFLANLQRMAEVPQQRAAAIMQMAAGAIPPPAALVWSAQEVVSRVRQLVRQRLAAQQGTGGEAAAGDATAAEAAAGARVAQVAAAAAGFRSEPWYGGALQLARLAAASRSQPTPSARTELELLRAFVDRTPLPPPAASAASAASTTAASPAPLPYIPAWEDLLSLSELPALLDAAAAISPALAATLELTGLRPAAAATAGAVAEPPPPPWLLPQLRAAAATSRAKALAAAGIAPTAADAPLDADAVLTALAVGAPAADVRRAAAEWTAAASLLRRAEENLGCAGGASNVRREAVAVLQLLGLPLEPRELPHMDELKVSEQEVMGWISTVGAQIATGAVPLGTAAVPIPRELDSRLQSVRQRLATTGRALALLAPEPGPASAAAAVQVQAAAATAAWLRTVGKPLVSGLLCGGYGSLRKLRSMVPELREALLLGLQEAGRTDGGVAALTAALYGDAEAAWRSARSDGASAATATTLLQREAVAAELDFVHEKFVAPAPELQPPPPLPSDEDLAAAVRALPPPARQLYDSYYALRPDVAAAAGAAGRGGASAAAAGLREQLPVLEALAAAGEDGLKKGAEDLQGWLAEARKGLLLLPPPLLALLLRFVRVQVSVTPEVATSQRNKLTALAALVAEQQCRAAAGGRQGAEEVAEAEAAAELAEWSRGGSGGRMGAAVAAVLGPQGALDFTSWMQALALTSSPSLSTHELLAQQHMAMDVERYLVMTHDPRLHLPASGVSRPSASTSACSSTSTSSSSSSARPTSSSWTDPALRPLEPAWLEAMRPQLDAYLQAMGHRALGEAEWVVYRDAALAEWEAGRPEREARAAAAGESGFCNPRADEVYLQQLLERNIAPGDPLGAQSRRYLDTLLRNPTWSFAQRKRAVERLIQLNDYFLSQPADPAEGSPFAPLFAVGGPDPVPRLAPLGQGRGAGGGDGKGKGKAVVGSRGVEGGVERLTLPEGF